MRPKSSATVVVRLASTPLRSSTLSLIALITSSVRSGLISLTEVTMVVLPTPKPPAMSTLTAEVVDLVADRADHLLGAQRPDLAHRGDHGRLAYAEAARDEHLDRGGAQRPFA